MKAKQNVFAAGIVVSVGLCLWGGYGILAPTDAGQHSSVIRSPSSISAFQETVRGVSSRSVGLGENEIDLGEVEEGIKLEVPLALTNSTTETVEIAGFRTSCGCAEISASMPLVLAPGQHSALKIELNTLGKHESFQEELAGYRSGGEDLVRVKVKGYAIARLAFSPPAGVVFPTDADKGISPEVQCMLRCGPRPLTQIRASVRSPWDQALTVDCPSSLASGETALLRVKIRALPTVSQARIPVVVADDIKGPLGFFEVHFAEDAHLVVDPPQLLLGQSLRQSQTTVTVCGEFAGKLQIDACTPTLATELSQQCPRQSLLTVKLGQPLAPEVLASAVVLKHEKLFARIMPVFFAGHNAQTGFRPVP